MPRRSQAECVLSVCCLHLATLRSNVWKHFFETAKDVLRVQSGVIALWITRGSRKRLPVIVLRQRVGLILRKDLVLGRDMQVSLPVHCMGTRRTLTMNPSIRNGLHEDWDTFDKASTFACP